MAISNLETIIDNIEQMIDNVRPDNRGRIMLPKDTLRQLIGELKTSIPDEIKRYNEKARELELSKNRELEQARHNAERIMNEANEMKELIKAYGLPVEDEITAEEAVSGAMNDKKKRGNTLSVILVNKIGESEIRKMSPEEFHTFLRGALA